LFGENDDQEEIFNKVCLPMLSDVYNEFKSGVIFSYGVTNSGKTYTIIGNKEKPGLLP
jgi:kinesin family protein 20